MKIFIGNLSPGTTRSEMEEAFAPFGDIVSAEVVMDVRAGQSRGFGFIEMANVINTKAAIQSLDGAILGGRMLAVSEAYTHSSESADRRQSAHGGSNRW